jgi:hypothetical protein
MKRFSTLFLLLLAPLLAAPLAAKTPTSPYKALIVKRFLNSSDAQLPQGFVEAFNSSLLKELQKQKAAEQVVAEDAALAPADAARSLRLEGGFIHADSGHIYISGSVEVSASFFRLNGQAPLKTVSAKGSFKGALSDDEKDLAAFVAEQIAYAIKQELIKLPLNAAPPAPAAKLAPAAKAEERPAAAPAPPAAAQASPSQPSSPTATSPAPSAAATAAENFATIQFVSEPAGAEIAIDGEYAGNAPSRIKIKPGRHTFQFSKPGFQPWTRTMEIRPGEERNLAAELAR